MLTQQPSVQCEPDPSIWKDLLNKAQGTLSNQSIEHWQEKTREQLNLPSDRPIIIVGHQPTVFHVGILAKFIAGDILAKQVGGDLVHLVVDHHIGDVGTVEIPIEEKGEWCIEKTSIAPINDSISLKDQDRVSPTTNLTLVADALRDADGDNAAMQFGNAMGLLMEPYAKVDACISTSELLGTGFGKAIVDHMFKTSEQCNETYNQAIQHTPRCNVSPLQPSELPLWSGVQNDRGELGDADLRPRALLLTLLARVGLADVFIHGTGGFAYDKAMERWSHDWLAIKPCPSTMITTSMYLQLGAPLEKATCIQESELEKLQLVRAIQDAPYQSEERVSKYQALQSWLDKHGQRVDKTKMKHHRQLESKRNWIFPLFPKDELLKLREEIEHQCFTTDFAVAK